MSKPTTIEESVQAIRLFIQKVEWIKDYSIFKEPLKYKINHKIGSCQTDVEKSGPYNEALDAVLLHLRFFIVGNESTCLQYTGDLLDLLNPEDDLRDKIESVISKKNKWEHKDSGFFRKKNLCLLSLYLNSHRIHANDTNKVRRYEEMMEPSFLEDMEFPILYRLVMSYFAFVFALFPLYQDVLDAHLSTRNRPPQE